MCYLEVYKIESKGCREWNCVCSETFHICTQVCLEIVTYICGSIFVGWHVYSEINFVVCRDLYAGVVHGKHVHTLICLMEVTYMG